jgi:dihydroorotate dehydrogenase
MVENLMMLRGSLDPNYFKAKVRPLLYRKCGGDPEAVHELVLDQMHSKGTFTKLLSPFFKPPKNIMIRLNGLRISPFGTAAGMDKNCDALAAFGNIFGFQESGTIVLSQRDGNPRIRMAVLERELDVLNSQGFPSKGVLYSQQNLSDYRRSGGKAVIYSSICGLPGASETDGIGEAVKETRLLVLALGSYVDGFVWNPFSPNTAALKRLRGPSIVKAHAQVLAEHASTKLRLIKIGPYKPEQKDTMLELVKSFIDGGGHGIVTTNTDVIPKADLPGGLKESWGYQSAGRSGRWLSEYRLRSLVDMRSAFPDAVIVATGGIYEPADAYKSFKAGATMLEGYTPYVYFGAGLLRALMRGVSQSLERDKFSTLAALQHMVRGKALKGELTLDYVLGQG